MIFDVHTANVDTDPRMAYFVETPYRTLVWIEWFSGDEHRSASLGQSRINIGRPVLEPTRE